MNFFFKANHINNISPSFFFLSQPGIGCGKHWYRDIHLRQVKRTFIHVHKSLKKESCIWNIVICFKRMHELFSLPCYYMYDVGKILHDVRRILNRDISASTGTGTCTYQYSPWSILLLFVVPTSVHLLTFLFISRTSTMPWSSSTKLGTKHPCIKGILVYSTEGQRLFERWDNNIIVKNIEQSIIRILRL